MLEMTELEYWIYEVYKITAYWFASKYIFIIWYKSIRQVYLITNKTYKYRFSIFWRKIFLLLTPFYKFYVRKSPSLGPNLNKKKVLQAKKKAKYRKTHASIQQYEISSSENSSLL